MQLLTNPTQSPVSQLMGTHYNKMMNLLISVGQGAYQTFMMTRPPVVGVGAWHQSTVDGNGHQQFVILL